MHDINWDICWRIIWSPFRLWMVCAI